MAAILAIEAPTTATADLGAGGNERDRRGPDALQWKRRSTARLVEAVATFAGMGSFVVALVVMAGECLGDATVAGIAGTMVRTARVAMPHVAEFSSLATALGT